MGIPLQRHLHTHSFHITLLREITRKKMERKRKEREVELKEKKTSDVESTTISTITPVELSIEISSKTTK